MIHVVGFSIELAIGLAIVSATWLCVRLVREFTIRRLAGVKAGDLWETRRYDVDVVAEALVPSILGTDTWLMSGDLLMYRAARERGEWWLVMRAGCPTPQWFRRWQRSRNKAGES